MRGLPHGHTNCLPIYPVPLIDLIPCVDMKLAVEDENAEHVTWNEVKRDGWLLGNMYRGFPQLTQEPLLLTCCFPVIFERALGLGV